MPCSLLIKVSGMSMLALTSLMALTLSYFAFPSFAPLAQRLRRSSLIFAFISDPMFMFHSGRLMIRYSTILPLDDIPSCRKKHYHHSKSSD